MTASLSETQRYHNRIKTFETWPAWAKLEPEPLARAGFFYKKERDVVKCEYCGGKFYNWKKGDDPFKEHKSYYPNCRYMLHLSNQSGLIYKTPPSFNSASRNGGEAHTSVAVAAASIGRAPPAVTRNAKQNNFKAIGASLQGSDKEAETRGAVAPATPHSAETTAQPGTPKNSEDNRKVARKEWMRSRIDLPFVQLVMDKGYKRSDVQTVLMSNWKNNRDVKNAVSLVRQIYELEDKEKREPEAARVALETEPLVTSWKVGPGEQPAGGGDNCSVSDAEAGYGDPGRDPRYQRLPSTQQLEAKAQLAQPPPKLAGQGASATFNARPEVPRPSGPPGATGKLQKDAVKVRANSICVICKTTVQGCIFLPCTCLCTCPKCAITVNNCPECKKEIEHRMRVYLG